MRLKTLTNGLLVLLSSASMAVEPPLVGGWYPLFFPIYDQKQVDSIIQTIQENQARRIVVLYDKNKPLADKIISNIQSKVNFSIERSQDVPKGNETTQYNHEQVVVSVFRR